MFALLAFFSLLIELALGYPQALVKSIGHPVIWIGVLISWLDRTINRETDSAARRRVAGILALLIIVGTAGGAGWLVTWIISRLSGAGCLTLLLTAAAGSTLLAQRSLGSHVKAVADALDRDGLPAGRNAVSMIVGRDPETLDEAAVCRAAIESLAENFSDGVVAPAFWLGVGGLPCAAAYKAVNTADSMIGHKKPRYLDFGWASARFDDLVNLPASRLTALLLVLSAYILPDADGAAAWRAIWRDADKHKSPNAGWPEAAMAGALGVALAGPRSYAGVLVDDVFMGEGGRREANSGDIRRALKLYWTADGLLIVLLAVAAGILAMIID